jgi:hypothetical protein
MTLPKDHIDLLKHIQNEWNQAEEDIKTAEQVVQNIVIPAIKELRYGGRRIVDALALITSDEPNDENIRILLEEARFDCRRARHDAVDAATAKIAADLEIMVKQLGYEAILPVYSEFPKLYNNLQSVREKIAQSRGQRDNRDAIYAMIESTHFPGLVVAYNEMRLCENMMIALAKKNRRSDFFAKYGLYVGLAGVVLAIIGIMLALK